LPRPPRAGVSSTPLASHRWCGSALRGRDQAYPPPCSRARVTAWSSPWEARGRRQWRIATPATSSVQDPISNSWPSSALNGSPAPGCFDTVSMLAVACSRGPVTAAHDGSAGAWHAVRPCEYATALPHSHSTARAATSAA
jgi:hypothetical protein